MKKGGQSHRAGLNAAGESLALAAQVYSGRSRKGLGTKQAERTKTFFFFCFFFSFSILVVFAVC